MLSDYAFLGRDCQMTDRIQDYDWSATSLGPAPAWPDCLKSTLSLMLSSPVPMSVLWGPEALLLYNDAYIAIAGDRHPASLGQSVYAAWPELAEFNRDMMRVCLDGGSVHHTDLPLALHRPEGPRRLWLSVSCSPVRDGAGRPLGVLAVISDTTQRVLAEHERERALRRLMQTLEERVAQAVAARNESEERLHQAQKMEAIGKLTGGVAHDFNNVLQIINGNLHLLGMDARGNERIERRIKSANAAVARGAQLASQLLAFARRQPLNPASTNLGRLISAMDEVLRRVLGPSIAIHTHVQDRLWNTLVDGNQLENALLNLAINAREAMDGRGELTIEARNAQLEQSYCQHHPGLSPGDYVMLAVSDNGQGMAPEVVRQAFEPFFTTKPAGKGAGLGLSMVHGFVHQSGGHVHLYSEAGVGTTVRLYLPRSISEAIEPIATAQEPVSGGKETILLVDDDEQVRATAADMLRGLGYNVLKAEDPDEAMRMLEGGAAVDLLFTDVVMPGKLKSPELARRAQQMLPMLEVLFTSGYTADAITHDGRLDPGVELLSKPYGRDELARRVRQLLDRGKRVANQPYVDQSPEANGGGSAA